MNPHEDAIVGAILGTAVGDAIGLPYEGLSRRRGARLFGEPDRHRFLLGRGMVSDDTEHTCLVAQALIASGGQVEAFTADLARRLRYWLLGLPAGLGRATLLATLRLWVGVPPERSGVFSAGNGPVMRAPIIGAAVDDLNLARELVRASTRMTHTDPKAEAGALAVTLAAWHARRHRPPDSGAYLDDLSRLNPPLPDELLGTIRRAAHSAAAGESTIDFAAALGLTRRVTGYVYHTVPTVMHAWLRHPDDYRSAVTAVIRCGGDTDTTAAIVGGILGSALGRPGIPADWLAGLWEWPRTVAWMDRLGRQLAQTLSARQPASPLRLPALGLLARNLAFLAAVLGHGVRRTLPPY
jgi:ADP-ribosylglycohydrolase